MKLRIDEHTLPRYQTIGVFGLVAVLLIALIGYLLTRNHYASLVQLNNLRNQIIGQQLERTRDELKTTIDLIRARNDQAETVLMEEARSQVRQAWTIAHNIWQQQSDRLPEQELKTLIREALRNVRFFNGRGYLFIIDRQGRSVLSFSEPEKEGKSIALQQDDHGRYLNQEFIRIINDSPDHAGHARYRWYSPGDREMSEKISWLQLFEPYDWIIGAGDYIHEFENDLKADALKRIESLRFGENGYIAVIAADGQVISSPGWSVVRYSESEEAAARLVQQSVKEIVRIGREGGGIARYRWFYPDGRGPVEKVSQVLPVPGWDWYLVSGVYPEDVDILLQQQRARLEGARIDSFQTLMLSLLIATALALILALLFSRGLGRLFRQYQQEIERKQRKLTDNARDLQVAASVFQNSAEGIIIADPQNHIVAVNEAFTRITGYSEQEVLGRNPAFMASGKHDQEFYGVMWRALAEEGRWSGEIWNRRRDGQVYPEWLAIIVSRDEQDRISNYIATITDLSERKDTEEKLRYLADYDPLTDLPNRRLLAQRVARAIRIADRHHKPLALFFIDLDRFKNVNDSLGHGVGDQILQLIAGRLAAMIRPEDTLSRLGGDEFVVVMADRNLPAAAATLSERIQRVIAEPMEIEQRSLVLTPSIGIAIYPDDGRDFETLSRNADAALYHAKGLGRNNFQFYTDTMNREVSRRLEMEAGLRQALREGQFELHYQPLYRLSDGQLCGCEALIRWHSPERGFQRPDQFIPLAEEIGLIIPIGDWVLLEACRQGAGWLEAGLSPGNIAVNVSAQQFDESLVASVQQVLTETGYPAAGLTLEITESVLMENADQAVQLLSDLKNLGVGIALDDFGTGYSSLACLKKFPLDKLKIDRAFIDGLPADQDDAAITSSIIDIARNLRLQTVAEGIETAAQREHLQSLGCEQVQGYYYARPMPENQFRELLVAEAGGAGTTNTTVGPQHTPGCGCGNDQAAPDDSDSTR